MPGKLKYLLFLLICICGQVAFAQSPTNPNYPQNPNNPNSPNNPYQRPNLRGDTSGTKKNLTDDQMLDTIRKRQEHKKRYRCLQFKIYKSYC